MTREELEMLLDLVIRSFLEYREKFNEYKSRRTNSNREEMFEAERLYCRRKENFLEAVAANLTTIPQESGFRMKAVSEEELAEFEAKTEAEKAG